MSDDPGLPPVLRVDFYRSSSGAQPVRDWLLELSREDRKSVGADIRTAQYGWPLGMPLIRKLAPGLWEVRSRIRGGIARTIFTVEEGRMVLLSAFVKKSQRTPADELKTAQARLADLRREK